MFKDAISNYAKCTNIIVVSLYILYDNLFNHAHGLKLDFKFQSILLAVPVYSECKFMTLWNRSNSEDRLTLRIPFTYLNPLVISLNQLRTENGIREMSSRWLTSKPTNLHLKKKRTLNNLKTQVRATRNEWYAEKS